MKILFLNYEYPPLGGGAGNATAEILREWAKRDGVEVDLVTSSIDRTASVECLSVSVTIHRVAIGKNGKNLHRQTSLEIIRYIFAAGFVSAKRMAAAKRSGRPYDATLAFFTVPSGFVAWLLGVVFGVPYVIALRGSDVPGYSERFSFHYRLITPIITFLWRRAKRVIANSRGLSDLAQKSAPDLPIDIVPNGVDIRHFVPGVPREDRSVITLGATRLTERKGTKYLIEALPRLLDRFPVVLVRIMGEGSDRTALESLVESLGLQDHVEFLGRIPRDNTAPYYREAKIFVLPSLNEGMSNAMLEALASGLPILSTDTGGADELVEDGVNGYIINKKDSDDIAEKISWLLSNEPLRAKMGTASRTKAEHMDWSLVSEKFLEALRMKR